MTGCRLPVAFNCDGVGSPPGPDFSISREQAAAIIAEIQTLDLHTPRQIELLRVAPCRLAQTTVVVFERGRTTGDTKGELQCPPDGNQAPSVRWAIRDWYGFEYAYYQLSQYACWNGQIVTASNGTDQPPPPIITAGITALGQAAGVRYRNQGTTSSQYEQWNGNAKGIYRVVQSNILFTGAILWDIDGLIIPNPEFDPTLSIAIRADGSVERGCSGGASTGGSCPED